MDVQEGVSTICRYFGEFDVNVQEGVSPFCRYLGQFEVDMLEGVWLCYRDFGQCEVRLVFVRIVLAFRQRVIACLKCNWIEFK